MKLQIVFIAKEEGICDVIKQILFVGGCKREDAIHLCRGEAYAPPYMKGQVWRSRKAFQLLLNRIAGVHVRCVRMGQTQNDVQTSRSSTRWRPSPDAVREGMAFIKQNLPPDSNDLEQLTWMVIQRTSDSPIFGWPENVVSKAVQRLNALNSDADSESFYPLLTFDLQDVFRDNILPLILPFAKEHGLLVAGWPGIGKTQFAKIWAMLLGRFWLSERDIDNRKASWRRGTKIERFRSKVQEVQELLMLDDPNLDLLDLEDVKAWFDLTEIGSGSGRYSDTKYCLNGPRALLTNELDFDAEPHGMFPPTSEEFWKMVKSTFQGAKHAHLYAIFKRCITLIGGRNAIYVRLPSEDPAAPIHRFGNPTVAKDWLKDGNKSFLLQYRQGANCKYEGYDRLIDAEDRWAKELLSNERYNVFTPQPVNHIPASTEEESFREVIRVGGDGRYDFPPIPQVKSTSNKRSRFRCTSDEVIKKHATLSSSTSSRSSTEPLGSAIVTTSSASSSSRSSAEIVEPIFAKTEPADYLTDEDCALIIGRQYELASGGVIEID